MTPLDLLPTNVRLIVQAVAGFLIILVIMRTPLGQLIFPPLHAFLEDLW